MATLPAAFSAATASWSALPAIAGSALARVIAGSFDAVRPLAVHRLGIESIRSFDAIMLSTSERIEPAKQSTPK
jgi:hypothetical protein